MLGDDTRAYAGWRHLFSAIVTDCQRVASGTNWETWIKGGGPERICQEAAWLWNRSGFRRWIWEDWEKFQGRSVIIFDTGVRYCGLDENYEPDTKVKNAWVETWTRAIDDSVGTPDDLSYFIGDSHVWAIQFEGMFPTDRKNLIERGWESCRKNARLGGLTADEVWQYEGLFHREYTGHNVAMGYMNLLALHSALQEEEIERFQDRIQMEKDFGQQTETLLAVKRVIPGGQDQEEILEPDSGRSPCGVAVRPVEMIPLNQGAVSRFSWADVRIVFIDDSTFRIHIPGEFPKRKTFADAGFSDKRKGLPDSQWDLLLDMAEKGFIKPSTRRKECIKKSVSRVRRKLEKIVGLPACPIIYDHKEKAYRPEGLRLEDKRCGGAGGVKENEVEGVFRDRSRLPAKSKKADSVTD